MDYYYGYIRHTFNTHSNSYRRNKYSRRLRNSDHISQTLPSDSFLQGLHGRTVNYELNRTLVTRQRFFLSSTAHVIMVRAERVILVKLLILRLAYYQRDAHFAAVGVNKKHSGSLSYGVTER